jgi:hypothetical protein
MFRFTIRELLLLTIVTALGIGWWLERRALTGSRDQWRLKAEELQRGTVPYTYSAGTTRSGFQEYTLRLPIVPTELEQALKRAEEAEAELRQRRSIEAKVRE